MVPPEFWKNTAETPVLLHCAMMLRILRTSVLAKDQKVKAIDSLLPEHHFEEFHFTLLEANAPSNNLTRSNKQTNPRRLE